MNFFLTFCRYTRKSKDKVIKAAQEIWALVFCNYNRPMMRIPIVVYWTKGKTKQWKFIWKYEIQNVKNSPQLYQTNKKCCNYIKMLNIHIYTTTYNMSKIALPVRTVEEVHGYLTTARCQTLSLWYQTHQKTVLL